MESYKSQLRIKECQRLVFKDGDKARLVNVSLPLKLQAPGTRYLVPTLSGIILEVATAGLPTIEHTPHLGDFWVWPGSKAHFSLDL